MPLERKTDNVAGVLFLCFGIMVFALQDAAIKAISGSHAVTLAIFLRAIISFPVLTAMVAWQGGLETLQTPQAKYLYLRGFILLMAYTSYFMAFPALPLAEAIALYFLVPLFVALFAIPILGETVKRSTWVAFVFGLLGVMVILQPGFGEFRWAALLSLLSAALYAFAMVLARRWGEVTSAPVIAFYANVSYLLGALTFAVIVSVLNISPPGHPSLDFLFRPWDAPKPWDMFLMGVCGVVAAIGMTALTQAYRKAEANVVAPFEYTGMIWGVVFGLLFFGEIPSFTTICGMILIAASGLVALYGAREKPTKENNP
jgi:drug/metabolite transporter (DMT)-like permease